VRLLFALALIFSACFLYSFSGLAQDVEREVIRTNISKQSYDSYPDANAIVLYEKGFLEVSDRYEQVYRFHRIVKILKQSAFDEANITQVYANSDDNRTVSEDIMGITYNVVNGQVEKKNIDKDAVVKRRLNSSFYELKFTLPSVKEGSIIEYAYVLRSGVSTTPPSWTFQNLHPTLKSEYETKSPGNVKYTYIPQATPAFKQCETLKACQSDSIPAYRVVTNGLNFISVIWGRKNICPAIIEPHTNSGIDYVERLDLQLLRLGRRTYTTNWTQFNAKMMYGFKDYIDPDNHLLNDPYNTVIKKADTDLEKAKCLFNYVRSNFHCEITKAIYPGRKIDMLMANKTGNAADLNLLMVSLLKKAGISASPVLLSTKGSLKINQVYPLPNRFNHLVCMAMIDGKNYFLDASSKNNSFGLMPVYCYNGYARIIDTSSSSIVLDPASVKEKQVSTLTLDSINSLGYNINVVIYMGRYRSRDFRNEVKGDIKKLKENLMSNIEAEDEMITGLNVLYLDNPDTNLIVKYQVHKRFEKPVSKIFFDLDYFKFFKSNPFISTTRRLPVEFNSLIDDVYVLQAKFPDNIELEELPAPSILSLEENKMIFRHLLGYDSTTRMLSVNSKFQVNHTTFPVESYETIQEFFGRMIKESNHTVVFNIKE
jgi:Transglutaminase-like superfamily